MKSKIEIYSRKIVSIPSDPLGRKLFISLSLSVFLLAYFKAERAASAQTQVTPRVELGTTYSDNINGAVKGREKDGGILEGNPGINISKSTGKTNLAFDASYNEQKYVKNHTGTKNHRGALSSNGSLASTLFKKHLTLNGNMAYTQVNDNPRENITADNRTDDSTSSDVLIYSLAPTFNTNHKGWVETQHQINYTQSKNDIFKKKSQSERDTRRSLSTTQESFNQTIKTGKKFSRSITSLANSYQKNKTSGGRRPYTTKSTQLSEEYYINRHFAAIGRVGYIKNTGSGSDFSLTSGGDQRSTSGKTWSLGGRYVKPKTDFSLEYGRRYNDRTWSSTLNFRPSSKITLSGTYTDEIQPESQLRNDLLLAPQFRSTTFDPSTGLYIDNVTQQPIDPRFVSLIDPITGVILDPNTGLPLDFNNPNFQNDNEVIRNKSLNVNLSGFNHKNTYTAFWQHAIVTNGSLSRDQTSDSFGVSYGRQLTKRASISFSPSFSRTTTARGAVINGTNNISSGNGADKIYRFSTSYQYRFSEKLYSSLSYSYLLSKPIDKQNERQENLVKASLIKTF